MRILGIDPGYGRMGFGCIDVQKGSCKAVDYGIISTQPGDFPGRLTQIADDLTQLLMRLKPDVVAFEKLYFSKNVKTALQVAEARGAAVLTCAKAGCRIVEFTPPQIKMAVTGDGKADKQAIQWMVKKLLQLSATPKVDDAADALAVAMTASTLAESARVR